jgi:5-formyltetrahydrofolate cyclo-ligase
MDNRAIKAKLRTERLAARDDLAQADRIEKGLSLASHGMGAIDVPDGAVVSGFLPIRSEVDVRSLMDLLHDKGARICVPVVVDRETIVFRELLHGADLIGGTFGTFGPGPEAPELDPDIMLVPLAAFDTRGHRIGYGGGYYDRAIERLQQKGLSPRLIGIAFDCQEVASVPEEPHDIRLHGILTESGYRDLSDEAIAKIG